MSKKQQIKDAFMKQELQREKHPMPGTSMDVWVRELSSGELETWREICRCEDDNTRRLNAAKLLQISLQDEDGSQIFDEKEIAVIGGMPARTIEPLVKATLRLSGYGAGADQAILKNLRKILGAAGLSDLLESRDAQDENSTNDTPPESLESSISPSSSGQPDPQPKRSKQN